MSSSYSWSSRASSTRGAWLVGPMNMPLNRYDSEGWFCQYTSRLASTSGRRRKGLSAGVAPPITMWLPPPVPVWRPSVMNFSADRRLSNAAWYRNSVWSTRSRQLVTGWMFASITPGSGVICSIFTRGSRGGG